MRHERFVSWTKCRFVDRAFVDTAHAINVSESSQPTDDQMFGSGLQQVPWDARPPSLYGEVNGTYLSEYDNVSVDHTLAVIVPIPVLQGGAGAPAELLTDGSFSDGLSSWGSPATWFATVDSATVSRQATHVAAVADSLSQAVKAETGKKYAATWTLRYGSGVTPAGSVTTALGGASDAARSAAGFHVDFLTPGASTRRDGLVDFVFDPTPDFNGSVAAVSLREAKSWSTTVVRQIDLWFHFMSRRRLVAPRSAGNPQFQLKVFKQSNAVSAALFSEHYASSLQDFPALEASLDSNPADAYYNDWAVPSNADYYALYAPFVFVPDPIYPTVDDSYLAAVLLAPTSPTSVDGDALERRFFGARIIYDVSEEGV